MYEFIPKYLPFFLRGLQYSLILALVPLALGFVVGLLAALADVYGGKIASALINIYVEFFRGSPLIVQAILFYWFIPQNLLKSIRHVVLPQALRIVIPGWTNEYASMSKSTSAAIAIGIPELANISLSIASWTFRSFETYTFTALLYFIWIFSSVKILELVYEKVKIPGFEA